MGEPSLKHIRRERGGNHPGKPGLEHPGEPGRTRLDKGHRVARTHPSLTRQLDQSIEGRRQSTRETK